MCNDYKYYMINLNMLVKTIDYTATLLFRS